MEYHGQVARAYSWDSNKVCFVNWASVGSKAGFAWWQSDGTFVLYSGCYSSTLRYRSCARSQSEWLFQPDNEYPHDASRYTWATAAGASVWGKWGLQFRCSGKSRLALSVLE
eukprot:6112066-Amphidinium_carterae.1